MIIDYVSYKSVWIPDLKGESFLEMVYIPAGPFLMGSVESEYGDEKPQREVYLTEYYMMKYSVTNKQFLHFIEETGYKSKDIMFLNHWTIGDDGVKRPPEALLEHPVVYVSWNDAQAFCEAYGVSLPSEARWEKAARGTDGRIYPWGNDVPSQEKPQCNFGGIFNTTTPVGTFDGTKSEYNGHPIAKGTSPYGCECMAGNVWEWCQDRWDSGWLKDMPIDPEVNMPVDPCNILIPKRFHLTREQMLFVLEQVLLKRLEEQEEQVPFQDTGSYEEEVGEVGSILLTSVGCRFAVTSIQPAAIPTLGFEPVGKDEKEEVEEKQAPFQDTGSYVEAVGTFMRTSVGRRFAATAIQPTATTSLGFGLAGKDEKEEVEKQVPFQDTGSRMEEVGSMVRTTVGRRIAPTTKFPSAATTNLGFESVGEEEEEVQPEQVPFPAYCASLVEEVGTVMRTTVGRRFATSAAILPFAATLGFESVGEEEQEKQDPFQDAGSFEEGLGTIIRTFVGRRIAATSFHPTTA